MKKESLKAKKLRLITDEVIMLGNWMLEASRGGDGGVPTAADMCEASQRYDLWYSRHREDLAKRAGRGITH